MPTRERRAKMLGVSVDDLPPDGRGRHGSHASGADHPRWSGKRLRSSHGYVKVRVGKLHPLADPNGYAYEHTLVWIAAGKFLGSDEVLHHRNGDKADNRLENLEACNRGTHVMEHHSCRDPRTGRLISRGGGR